jgi:hypothetical protein
MRGKQSPKSLPQYAHPPLVQTTMAVEWASSAAKVLEEPVICSDFTCDQGDSEQMQPARGMSTAQGKRFPGISLAELVDQLGAEWSPVVDASTTVVRNKMGDRQLKLTDEGIGYSWLGYDGGRYPKYEVIRDGFLRVLTALLNRESATGLAPGAGEELTSSGWLQACCWRVEYVNRIPKGTVWETPADWGFFRPLGNGFKSVEPLVVAGFEGCWLLRFPEPYDGSLKVTWRHLSADDNRSNGIEQVVLSLIAEGTVEATGNEEAPFERLLEACDRGRAEVVSSFQRMTTSAAGEYWGIAAAPRG